MQPGSKIHALLSTARTANIPSVVSNVGVGILLGCTEEAAGWDWPWMLMLGAVCLYVAGNFLNDWADREWDAEHRPERALPRGMFRPGFYLGLGLALMTGGLWMVGTAGWVALVVGVLLVGLILLYTKVHKEVGWSVVPMGLCRAALPVLGYAGMRGAVAGPVIFPAAALFLYVAGLSVRARGEAAGGTTERRKGRWMLFGAGLVAAVLPVMIRPETGWLGLVPFGVWVALCIFYFRAPVGRHVSALLAGIPLVDWVTMLPMGLIWLGSGRVGVGSMMFLNAMLLAPVCFVLGRNLQRVAAAT